MNAITTNKCFNIMGNAEDNQKDKLPIDCESNSRPKIQDKSI